MRAILLFVALIAVCTAFSNINSEQLYNSISDAQARAADHASSQARRALSSLHAVKRAMAEMPEMVAAMAKKRQATGAPSVSQGCLTAYNDFVSVYQSNECATLGAAWDNINNASVDTNAFAANVETVCGSNCLTNLRNATRALQSACPSNQDLDNLEAFILVVLQWSRVTCFRDGNTRCLPVVRQSLQTLNSQNGTDGLTEQQLNAFCQPCFVKLVAAFAVISGADDDQLVGIGAIVGFICLRDRDTNGVQRWCMLEVQALDGPTTQPFGNLNILCRTTCVNRYVSFLLIFADDATANYTAQIMGALRFICLRRQDGEFCMPLVIQTFADQARQAALSNCEGLGQQPPSCNGSCTAAMNAMNRDLGCCFNSFLAVIRDVIGGDIDRFLVSTAIACAGQQPALATFPATCNAEEFVGNIIVDVVLTNLRRAWLAVPANRARLALAIRLDLALSFGVDRDDVTVTVSDSGAVSGTIVPETADQGSNAPTTVTTDTIQLNNANQAVGLSGLEDITQAVGASSVSASYVPPNSASSVVASAVLVAAVAVLAMMF